jgi:Tol biopolymer transport system component
MLAPGTRLGPYEITAQIGEGGMGQVYRATDTRLGRTVAIKVLPEHLASDFNRRERFAREARAVSALNHPHICVLHDVGEHDGTHYLVMELVEGQTLEQQLQKGRLPLNQALEYAIQIADALDKAHRKGIVHRDLKPGNIMLTKSGVKLLDFGLAKLRGDEGPVSTLSQVATETASQPLTQEGTIVGTLQYMAPEQLEGKDTDPRTDLFAFGALVYEMVTGKKAFEGKSRASVIAAILEREPVSMSSLQPVSPPALDRVVKKCLTKEPDRRWQAASDLHDELQWIAEGQQQPGGVPGAQPRAAITSYATTGSWRDAWLAWGVCTVAVLVAVGFGFVHLREAAPPVAPEMRLEISTPPTPDATAFALSPDGTQVVSVATIDGVSRLWLRQLSAATGEVLIGTEGALYPFWSPDGRSIGFFALGKLKRIDLDGGPPRELADAPQGRGGAWSRDGVILFTPTSGRTPLFQVAATGGEAMPFTRLLDEQTSHRFPHFVPGSRQFLVFVDGTPDTQGVYLGSLDADQLTRLTASDMPGVWLAPGWLVWMQGVTLLAGRLDLERRALAGTPVTLADQVARQPVLNSGAFSVSHTGLVAYRIGTTAERRQLTWLDRSGKLLGLLGQPDASLLATPRVSPDGRRVAVGRNMGSQDQHIWTIDANRTTRFTFDPVQQRDPVWSPDGTWIGFRSYPKGVSDLYVKRGNGAGEEELLLETTQNKVATAWSRDGRFIFFTSQDPSTGLDLWTLSLQGDRVPRIWLKTAFDESDGEVSPDGRWVAYMSNASGRREVYLRPFADRTTGGQWQISTGGGIYPAWSPDSQDVYYLDPDGTLMAVSVQARGADIDPGAPVGLFQTRVSGGGAFANQGRQYDVASDGRFLVNSVVDDIAPITMLQNWQPPNTP